MLNDKVSSSRFRADINGLRAWAVVAVIFYHFGLPGFGGGFAGVDVFFVISGFLMTGIVVAGLERGDGGFSLWAFYWARARRILPALIALCAVLLALGWFFLLPLEYKALGTQVVFSLVFLSNEKFWREAGYFDTASHEKWLLHTWSLSVEVAAGSQAADDSYGSGTGGFAGAAHRINHGCVLCTANARLGNARRWTGLSPRSYAQCDATSARLVGGYGPWLNFDNPVLV